MMTFLIRLHPHNQSQPCTPDWQLQGSTEERDRPFCRHEGGYHSLAGLFIPTPAVWEPLTFSLTFLQRSWLPPCCSWVTQTLINACDIWRGICDWADISLHCAWPTSPHSWRTGLYLVASSHTVSSSDSVHPEKRCCSKSVLVQLCEQVQSVRHICCVLCKSVCLGRCHLNSWALTVHAKPLMAFTNTVHLLRV